ncbi:MAG: glycosyl transferase [Bacteroidetes bacterium]|nr:MAG: glycosyl transferase [Bacteroidota bacterium]MBL1143658.1 glycosyl transferase [Bacteroidota bacterium]NOG56460.1 glycosyl transferase [Bacteroidota bacterium]
MKESDTLYFCTLFDTSYLSRGLALYNSLEKQCQHFKLYIVAFNQKSHDILKTLNLQHAIIISLEAFENERLLSVKPHRGVGEYCWTSTSSVIKYCLETYHLDHCTYLDSDLYFFSSPLPLLSENPNKSVLITEHRYTPKYDQSEMSGIYCVQFMYFKNDELGLKCLNWWVDACIEWCYAIPEDGKFGDQKYLDDWTERFDGIHELEHLGGGVAPWNVQQYKFELQNNKLIGLEKKTNKVFDVVFFHFHDVRFLNTNEVDFGNYTLEKDVLDLIYKPYLKALDEAKTMVQKVDREIDPHGTRNKPNTLKDKLKRIKRKFDKNFNLYPLD